jgi:hypothetical protein
MGNMAIDLTPASVIQMLGELAETDGRLVVRTRSGSYAVRRALSCLIEPVAGDRVLVAFESEESVFVLAVLERASAAPSRVVFDGDAELYAPSGRLEIGARDGISIASPEAVEMTSNRLRVNAVEAQLTLERASYAGAVLSSCVDSVKLAANTLDAVIDRWTQRVRQSLRRVEELDQVKAGQIDHSAQDTLSLHGNNTMLTANQLVRVDGKQIHVG